MDRSRTYFKSENVPTNPRPKNPRLVVTLLTFTALNRKCPKVFFYNLDSVFISYCCHGVQVYNKLARVAPASELMVRRLGLHSLGTLGAVKKVLTCPVRRNFLGSPPRRRRSRRRRRNLRGSTTRFESVEM